MILALLNLRIDCGLFLWQPGAAVLFTYTFLALVFGIGFSPGCCCNATCTNCEDDAAPREWQVDLDFPDGDTSPEGGSECCGDLSGTFFVDEQSAGGCCWHYNVENDGTYAACGATPEEDYVHWVYLKVTTSGADYLIHVATGFTTIAQTFTNCLDAGPGMQVLFVKNYGATKPACVDLVNEVIPPSGGALNCDGFLSDPDPTCEVTAL